MRKKRKSFSCFCFPDARIFGELETETRQFYCYVQHKPSNAPFYVGKGYGLRYKSKSGRNKAYLGTLRKYGEASIQTYLFPMASEVEAFRWEKDLIYMLRCQGFKLVNWTNGGDGVVGHKVSRKTRKKLRDVHKGKIKVKLRATNLARRNSVVIDTPWGRLGLFDASLKVGIGFIYFKKRYEKGLPPEKLFDPKQGHQDGSKNRGRKRTLEQCKNISQGKITRDTKALNKQIEARNKLVIDTPWGPMGAYDASVKAGVEWNTFDHRLFKNKTGEKLFKPSPRRDFLKRTNAIVIDTPWGPMGQHAASVKAGIRWITFKHRLTKGYTEEKLFKPVRKIKRKNNFIVI